MFGILYVSSEQKINAVQYERQTRTNSDFQMLTNSQQEQKEGIFRISFNFQKYSEDLLLLWLFI